MLVAYNVRHYRELQAKCGKNIAVETRGVFMRINVLQHTPNEGPGSIREWSVARGHEMYVYHPY